MYILGGIIFFTAFGYAFKFGMGDADNKLIFLFIGVLFITFLLLANLLYF